MALVSTAVSDLAEAVLASVADRLADAGIIVPDRQYVHAGEVALDFAGEGCCSQLVVTASGLDHAMPGESPTIAVCVPPRHVSLHVWLTRCVPMPRDDGSPPSAADLNASGVEILTDLFVLPYVLWEGHRAEDWGATCASVLLGPVLTYGPEGGCGGVHAAVDVLVV